jgi:hypothetical protein
VKSGGLSSLKVGDDEEGDNLTGAAKKLLGPLGRVPLGDSQWEHG